MEQPRLLDLVPAELSLRHYSLRTHEVYIQWIKRYIFFHKKKHPKEMGKIEVESFLSYLATEKNVAASTQNQALSAILFLYKHVLKQEIEWIENVVRAKRPKYLPTILSPEEVRMVISTLSGKNQLVAKVLYGCGMRLMEALRLRVQDINFDYRQIIMRSGKGNKDRVTILPDDLVEPLQKQIYETQQLHNLDLTEGFGSVYMPYALNRKYPKADKSFGWQYIFASKNRSADPESGTIRRHHLHEKNLNRAIKKAVHQLQIYKRVSSHTFRHCFATPLLENGYDIRTVQELLGHKETLMTRSSLPASCLP